MLAEPRRELRLFAAAVQMLTRLPVPPSSLQADWLARSAKYFPLVGACVGALSAAALLGAARLWPGPVPGLVAIVVALLLTGALHEDGLADTADAEGGTTRERRLAIMKDPRLGSFGALALIVAVGLKAAALASLPVAEAASALVAAGAVSRAFAVVVMASAAYAGDRAIAKVDHGIEGPRAAELAIAFLFALLPLLLLDTLHAVVALALAALAGVGAAIRACRPLGGYTGDVLGAVIVVSEVAFLLGAAARW